METQVEIKTPINLASQVPVKAGDFERTLLVANAHGLVQLLTFAAGSGLTPHTANAPVVVTVVSGRVNFVIDGKEHEMKAGDAIVIPADTEHSVSAIEDTRIVLSKLGL
ncbi:MAG: cupin domain-containing protein [Bacteroidales bacterium]|nr:cupin domain-containing protein [Bacteroidales bacterium]MBD5283540.1 cupin domain-containing protein [Bacteroides sp.]